MSEQERRALLGSADLLSIAQASLLTPYSAEYLGLLARKGKLPAVKVSRDWLTTRKSVLSYVEKQKRKHASMLDALNEGRGML